jgi:hypothetical protein
LSSIFTEALPPKAFDERDPFFEGERCDVLPIRSRRFLEGVCDADDNIDLA